MRRSSQQIISFLIILAVTAFCSCQHKRAFFPTLDNADIRFVRFDSALLSVRADSSMQDIRHLYEGFPAFMPVYVEDILGFTGFDHSFFTEPTADENPNEEAETLQNALIGFLTDTIYNFEYTNRQEQQIFADVTDIEKPLSEAFARMKWLYPDWEIPVLYLFVSGFQSAVYFTEDGLAIGADMYLGKDYPYYRQVVYQYQLQTMRKECIPVDVVSAWLFSHIPYNSPKNRLLDQMLYRGKVMYLLACIFDRLPGYEVMGYTKEQWDWCEYHERAIWHRMMDKRDLFKTEQRILSSYLNDGPFTSEISQESPGRVGTWIGWRIVESYMEHNDSVSLQSLMEQNDAQLILERSFYKP